MLGEKIRDLLLRYRAGRALLLLVHNLDIHHAPVAASAMAFDAFLSLVPLAAFAGYVLSAFHESGDVLLGPILRTSPGPVADLVYGAVRRLSDDSTTAIAPVSIVAFLWTSSAGLSTAMYVFEAAFQSPPRPWWWRRGIAILLVLVSVGIVAVVTGLSIGVSMLSITAGAVFAVVVPSATVIGMLLGFFRIAVRRSKVFRRRRALPGVFITVVLWSILSALFSFYVTTLSRYATLYGGMAAVAIFLFWLWLLALALLVGGEVNAQLDGIREDLPPSMGKAAKPAPAGPAAA
jgi:membrane protein